MSSPVQMPSTPGIALAAVVSTCLMTPCAWRGAHDHSIGLAGQVEVVGVFALAADQRVVLLAEDRLSDAVFLRCDSVFDGTGRRVILHCENPEMTEFGAFSRGLPR